MTSERQVQVLPALKIEFACEGGLWLQIVDDAEDALMPLYEAGVERIVKGVGLGARGAFNLRALRIGDVLLELTTLVRRHKVKVEPNFTTLVMAIVVLEGLGRQLDPSLDLFAVAVPMLF